MTSIYHIENLDLSKNFSDLSNYLNSDAMNQQLHEVEHTLFKAVLEMGKIILNKFLEKKGTGKDSVITTQSEKIPFHSIKKRNYLSIFGNIKISRAYFWKPGSLGTFPLDAELNLPAHRQSYLLDKWIQHRVTEEPYEEAINSICDLLDLKVTKRVSQQIASEASEDVENYYKQKKDFKDEGTYLVAQVDCKGVIMVPKERPKTKAKEGFVRRAKGVSKIGTRKDAVVTADYTINPMSRTPKDILEGLMLINSDNQKTKCKNKGNKVREIKNKQIAGTMFGKEKAFNDLADRLHARDPQSKKPIYALFDGAVSLETGLMKELKKEGGNRGW